MAQSIGTFAKKSGKKYFTIYVRISFSTMNRKSIMVLWFSEEDMRKMVAGHLVAKLSSHGIFVMEFSSPKYFVLEHFVPGIFIPRSFLWFLLGFRLG